LVSFLNNIFVEETNDILIVKLLLSFGALETMKKEAMEIAERKKLLNILFLLQEFEQLAMNQAYRDMVWSACSIA
jgi:hypothetical protein